MVTRLGWTVALHKNERNKNKNIENVMLVGLATKSTKTSVWIAQHTTESR